MSPLLAESKDKILGDLLVDVVDNTNITKVSVGSKTRVIIEALSGKLGQMYRKFDLNLAQAFLVGAEGKYLDFFGMMMGVSRIGQEAAQVTPEERNVKFYVQSGTFGDINGGSSIVLTSGTIVSTGQAGSGVIYTVPYNVILSSSDSETYVPVRAARAGTASNVGARQLIYHNFIDYDDSASESLLVVNEAEVVRGQDGEIDTNYKFRISQQVTAAESANPTAIRLTALGVPGVADVLVIPYARGIGTYDVLIKATTATVPVGLLAAVNEALGNETAQGIVYRARAPMETGVSMIGTLTFRKRLSAQEESNIINTVTANVGDYINSLDIAEDFIVNEIVERVMATSDNIKNIGVANNPLDEVYIYRPTKLDDNKLRNRLEGDYSPKEDERLIVETRYAGNTPVLFRAAT